MRIYGIILFLLLLTSFSAAQTSLPKGFFNENSTEIGKPIKYTLVYRHPKNDELLFPDTSYKFFPFELIKKDHFPTFTREGISRDSVVYWLRTFEVRPVLYLSLPVSVIKQEDTTKIYPVSDSILLKQYLDSIALGMPAKDYSNFEKVPLNINYTHIAAVVIVVLLVCGGLYLMFGKTLVKRYRLLLLRKSHSDFLNDYEKLHKDFVNRPATETIEAALALWKEYLGKIEDMPINTFTTTEIITLYNRDDLKDNLHIIDRSIYGGVLSKEAESALIFLKTFSNKKFQERKREVNLGRH